MPLHGIAAPDLAGVFADRAGGRKSAHARHIENGTAGPCRWSAVQLIHLVLGGNVIGVVRQQLVVVGFQQGVDDFPVALGLFR